LIAAFRLRAAVAHCALDLSNVEDVPTRGDSKQSLRRLPCGGNQHSFQQFAGRKLRDHVIDARIPRHKVIVPSPFFTFKNVFNRNIFELDQRKFGHHMVRQPARDTVFGQQAPKAPIFVDWKL